MADYNDPKFLAELMANYHQATKAKGEEKPSFAFGGFVPQFTENQYFPKSILGSGPGKGYAFGGNVTDRPTEQYQNVYNGETQDPIPASPEYSPEYRQELYNRYLQSQKPKEVPVDIEEPSVIQHFNSPDSDSLMEKENPEQKLQDQNNDIGDIKSKLQDEQFENDMAAEDKAAEDASPQESEEDPKRSVASMSEEEQPQAPAASVRNDLLEAQRQRDLNIAGQGLLKGSLLFSAGRLKTSPDTALKVVGDNDKYVGMPMDKFKENLEINKFDPNSQMSKNVRSFLGQMGVKNIDPNSSAGDLEKSFPILEKYMQNQMNKDVQKAQFAQSLELRKQHEDNLHIQRMELAKNKQEQDAERARHNQEMENIGHEMAKARTSMVDLSGERLGLAASKAIESEDTIKKANARLNSVKTALDQLNETSQPLTVNRLNAIQIDLAGSMPFLGVGTSDYKAKSDKLENLNTRIAAVRQRYGNKLVDLRTAAPEVYQEVLEFAKSVQESLKRIKEERYQELAKKYSRSMGSNSAAGQRVSDVYNNKAPESKGLVSIRRKSDGVVKTLSADAAAKYLNDSDKFEQVK